MPALMSLGQMVDLALGSPEVGSVNFNVLHSLLRAMVNHLGVFDVEAEVSDEAEEVLRVHGSTATTDGLVQPKKKKDSEHADGPGKVEGKQGGIKADDDGGGGGGERRRSIGSTKSGQVNELEKKVEKLEQQWKELNSYPSNGELVEYMRNRSSKTVHEEEEEKVEGEKRRLRMRPVTDMWLSLQLSKKVDANTEGVGKSLSLIEDLFHEIESLRSGFDQMDQQLKDAKESPWKPNSSLPIGQLDATQSDDISIQQQDLEIDMMDRFPSADRLTRGRSAAASAAAAIAQLEESLAERFGRVTEEQEATKMRLDQLEVNITGKADRSELIGLGEDLNEKMTNLFCDMDKLRRSQKENIDAVNGMEEMVNQLQDSVNQFQETVNHLTEATQRLSDESINHQNHLETLFSNCKELNEKKADKEFVQNEVSIKADKEHLDEKLNSRNFHSTCDEINNTINDLVNQLMGHEDDWKKTTLHLNSAVESKLDRLEFGPFREELERQLRLIARKMADSEADGGGTKGGMTDEEAAGFRRQLIQNFHCISCNKPLDMKSAQRPVPCLPSIPRLPETHSLRPYTTFELSQIRQLAHSHGNSQQQQQPSASQIQDLLDLCNKPRFCGGSHTLTYPHRRITKLSLTSHLNPPPPPPIHLSSDNPPQPGSAKGGTGGGGGGPPSSKLLPNVHAPGLKSSSSSSVRQHQQHQPQRPLRVSRAESPLEPVLQMSTGNQLADGGGASITDQQQTSSSRMSNRKRERSKVISIAAMEEGEEEEPRGGDYPPEADLRSILSSSVSGFDNEAVTIANDQLETVPLQPVALSTEGAAEGQSSMTTPEGNSSRSRVEKKGME